jgi:hypothetical protein
MKALIIGTLFLIVFGCSTGYKISLTNNSKTQTEVFLNGKSEGKTDSYGFKELSFKKRSGLTDSITIISEKDSAFVEITKFDKKYPSGIISKKNIPTIKRHQSAFSSTTEYNIKYELPMKSQTISYGWLKLGSNEENVEIYIDGHHIGNISTGLLNKKVVSGSHTIMARKPYFMPATIKIDLKENDVFAFNFKLLKASGWIEDQAGEGSIIQAKGNLTVVTERNDYRVLIEGVEKIPPFELKNMPAGKYQLEVIRAGKSRKEIIIVNDGKTTLLDLDK